MVMVISVKCLLFAKELAMICTSQCREEKERVFSLKTFNSQTILEVWVSWDYLFSKLLGMCLCPSLEGYFCRLAWRRRHGSEQEILVACLHYA